MDALGSYLVSEMIKALGEGAVFKFGMFLLIFGVLWLQLRGIRRGLGKLTETVQKSFADGEKRFEHLEATDRDFEHRLTMLEQKPRGT